ncbi:MAG: phytoene desaturase family protein, partial [Gammaproteobacteria bacterium]
VDGAYYCAGGFQKFADAMAEGILRHGGKLQFRAEVSGIEITDGKVSGVRLPGGRRVEAPVVIANSDMRHTVGRLVGERYFPERYLKRMAKMSPSLSIFAVYIATDLDLKKRDIAHESFCYRDFDHDENFARTRAGEVSWISMTVPTLADPSLAPKGEHLIMLTTLLPYDVGMPWKEAKPLYMGKMLEIAEQYIPGLGGRLRYIDGGSPATMERYTQNHRGSAYGWDVTPDQVGPNRLANRSPIAGLYFAGHWSSPGGGVYGACVSGVQTAQLVLGLPKRDEFWSWLIREENNDNERKVKEIGSK